jgi:hypothetical protein
VLIEINETTLTITRDSRSDKTSAGLASEKAWRDANGALMVIQVLAAFIRELWHGLKMA